MNTDLVLHKYMRHLRIMNGGYVSLDAVELALRLALDELAESIPSISSTENNRQRHEFERLQINSQLRIGELEQELERLQTAANAEVAELRQQIAQMDADNAAMIRRNKELADELKQARLDRQEIAFHANGNGAASNPPYVLPVDLPFWAQPQALNGLDDEATDWWIGCAAGRHTWRTVPKPVQLRMVRHILSFGPESGAMKMQEFDAIKPDWMPGSGSHTKTLRLSWPQLNDWKVELEATR